MKSKKKPVFPTSINLNNPTYRRLRRWLLMQYGNYSETIVLQNTVKTFPEEFGIDNYLQNCRKKATRDRVRQCVEKLQISYHRGAVSDEWAVMPDSVYEHFLSRLGAYVADSRRYRIHQCLKGLVTKNLGPHIIVAGYYYGCTASREMIYRCWMPRKEDLDGASVGEYWRYVQFAALDSKKTVRAEIWYDRRSWSPRSRPVPAGSALT